MSKDAAAPVANVADARGLAFQCLPGCGFCCTASPLVLDPEAGPLAPLVTRADDGTLRIPVKGVRCSALEPDLRCGVYERRPAVCRVYPYSVHAGRRIQATVTLACPGVSETAPPAHPPDAHAVRPVPESSDMTEEARRVVAFVLAQPGAQEMARRAKETFAEFDRRMKEWGVVAPPDKLRGAFQPHLERLARPHMLPAFFAGLAEGDLLLERGAERAVGTLFEHEADVDLAELLAQGAEDAFAGTETTLWVEPDFAWTQPRWKDGGIELLRHRREGVERRARLDPQDLPTDWTEEAVLTLARHLARLTQRDHAEGAAAWVVDAGGYQATLPAAYGRVLGESALQVVLRAGIAAAEAGHEEVTPALARQGIAAYETSFHSLPTLGSIL